MGKILLCELHSQVMHGKFFILYLKRHAWQNCHFFPLLLCPDTSHFAFYIQDIMLPGAFERIKLKNAVER